MSTDLERMFATLSADVGQPRLMPAAALRRRADRRVRTQVAIACLAVALTVGGTAVGSQWILTGARMPSASGDIDKAPSPSASAAVTPATPTPGGPVVSASAAPSSGATQKPTPTVTGTGAAPPPAPPRSIPDQVFLSAREVRTAADPYDVPSTTMLPKLCGGARPSDEAVAVRRTRHIAFYEPGTPAGYVPDGIVDHTVTVYRRDMAPAFMAELRAAVRNCPSRTGDGITYRHRLLAPPGGGDESLLFEVTYPARDVRGKPTGGQVTRLVSAVRSGDAVLVLYEQGWEGGSSDPGQMARSTERATRLLTDWRR